MHPYLMRIGVLSDVQEHFSPYYHNDDYGNLEFSYSTSTEKYGIGFHRIPQTEGLWLGGNSAQNAIRYVFICHSALEAIAFLNLHKQYFSSWNKLMFIATGAGISSQQLIWIRENYPGRSFNLLFGNDLLGHIADLKTAASIRKMPVAVSLLGNYHVEIIFRHRRFIFENVKFSLNAFERVSGFRFKIRTYKARIFTSYLAQHNHAVASR